MTAGCNRRYVPPHLRGVDRNSAIEGATANNPSTRWNNLDRGSWNHRSSHGHYERTDNEEDGGHNRDGDGSPAGRGTGRWADLDRALFPVRRHYGSKESAKAVFFGDSFIKLFKLLNDYTDSVLKTRRRIEVHKYKGASAKGLCREDNENRKKIRYEVQNIRRKRSHNAYHKVERLVFCFGSVDIHMSYYYKKFVMGEELLEEDLKAIATDYVDFVASLETVVGPTASSLPKLIVGIYPSPLRQEDVGVSLRHYWSLEDDIQIQAVDDSDDSSMASRQARVYLFNLALMERCEYHNDNHNPNGPLEYWDVVDEVLTKTSDGTLEVKEAYRDVSDLNIHLVHETTLQLWIEKWPWYKALTAQSATTKICANNDVDKPPKASFVGYLQESFEEYRKTKPWAKRIHVAETMGVQFA